MKKFRDIISRTLIDRLGLSPSMLSRIEGDNPVCIELQDQSKIFISPEDNSMLLIFLEITIRDIRKIKMMSSHLIDFLIDNEEFLMKLKKDKIIIMSHLNENINNIEEKLLNQLIILNSVTARINS